MMRSYDDADILRRSDNSILVHEIPKQSTKHPTGGETLPRLKGTMKPKPVAKIIANTRNTMQMNQDEIQSWEEVSDIKVSVHISIIGCCRRPMKSKSVIITEA